MSQGLQIAAVPTLLLFGVVGCFLPRWIVGRVPNPEKALQLGSAFSAGIFLGAGMLHLLPDAQEDAEVSDLDHNYPISMLIVSFGFIALLAIELVAAELMDHPHKNQGSIADHDDSSELVMETDDHTFVSVGNTTTHSHSLVC
jgi:hypothetical protein